MSTQHVTLQRYRPEFQSGVLALILPIQTEEFAINITAAQQPDLCDIENFYQQGCGDFWLALVYNQVVGCIALKDIGNQQAALRKMFVAAEWRGKAFGVASALLNTLLTSARDRKVTDIFLGTTATFVAAHRFYEKNGFREITTSQLPARFPLMAVDSKFSQLSV